MIKSLSYMYGCPGESPEKVPMITYGPSLTMCLTTSYPIHLDPPVTMTTMPSCLGITSKVRREHKDISNNVI